MTGREECINDEWLKKWMMKEEGRRRKGVYRVDERK